MEEEMVSRGADHDAIDKVPDQRHEGAEAGQEDEPEGEDVDELRLRSDEVVGALRVSDPQRLRQLLTDQLGKRIDLDASYQSLFIMLPGIRRATMLLYVLMRPGDDPAAWPPDGPHRPLLETLLDLGADPAAPLNADGATVAHIVPYRAALEALFSVLGPARADELLKTATQKGTSPLHSALLACNVPKTRLLLELGANVPSSGDWVASSLEAMAASDSPDAALVLGHFVALGFVPTYNTLAAAFRPGARRETSVLLYDVFVRSKSFTLPDAAVARGDLFVFQYTDRKFEVNKHLLLHRSEVLSNKRDPWPVSRKFEEHDKLFFELLRGGQILDDMTFDTVMECSALAGAWIALGVLRLCDDWLVSHVGTTANDAVEVLGRETAMPSLPRTKERVTELLVDAIDDKNALAILERALFHDLTELQEICASLIKANMQQFLKSGEVLEQLHTTYRTVMAQLF